MSRLQGHYEATESLRGSLLFTTKFPRVRVTHLIDHERLKDKMTLEPSTGFEPKNPGLINRPNNWVIAASQLPRVENGFSLLPVSGEYQYHDALFHRR